MTAALLFLPLVAQGMDLNPPELEPRIREMMDYAYSQQYDLAQIAIQQVTEDYPDNPAGYFFLGTFWQLYIFDTGQDRLNPVFLSAMEQAQDKARTIIRNEENAWAYLYAGAVDNIRALQLSQQHRYFESIRCALRAPGELRRALQLDSSIVDSWLGLGMAEYLSYSASRYVLGLRLFGSLDQSLDCVSRTANGDGYFATTARYYLSWILAHERRYQEACDELYRLLELYPGNRMFRKLLQFTYTRAGMSDSAIAVGLELEQEIAEVQPDNIAAVAEVRLYLAQAYLVQGDSSAAAACCDSIIGTQPYERDVPRLTTLIRDARAMRRDL